MQKPALTASAYHELLQNRWSPRAFSDQSVSPEVLHALFERRAGRPPAAITALAYILAPRIIRIISPRFSARS